MAAPDLPRLDEVPLSLPARPLVSVVIPALNEEAHIVGLLESLALQDYGPDQIEVLVADGGSTDATRPLVEAFPSPFARIELVDNPRRVSAAGLNEGMDRARGDCWIILGAHSQVPADFVRLSVEALRRTGAACVGGVLETVGHGPTGRAIAAAMSTPLGVGNARFRYGDREGEVDTVAFGCYHRRAWEVVGRFGEELPRVDDDSYNARLRAAGGRIVLVPAIRSTYYARESFGALARQYFDYGAGKGALFAGGARLEPRHFVPAAAVGGGTLLALGGLRFRLPRNVLAALAIAYAGILATGATRAARRHDAGALRTATAIATMHAAYGAGFIAGALRAAFRRPGRSRSSR